MTGTTSDEEGKTSLVMPEVMLVLGPGGTVIAGVNDGLPLPNATLEAVERLTPSVAAATVVLVFE
jgi:hypothetical protein